MNVNFYNLKTLDSAARVKLLKRAETDIAHASEVAKRLIDEVRSEGDVAISKHLLFIDEVAILPGEFGVTAEEFESASSFLSDKVKAAIDHAIANVRSFHLTQVPPQVIWHEVESGVFAGEKTTPLDSVGLYVPRGKGTFPSVLIMLAVPAVVAKVPKIVVCTPPNPDGTVEPATLYAARRLGVHMIFKVGGASAIAALAFGTETIPKVVKLLGPGNKYCSAAKRLLSSDVDVGLPAGPSESIILCDEFASPFLAAIDLLIEAEHGPDSAALLVTDSEYLAKEVAQLLPRLIEELPEPRRGFCKAGLSSYGGIVLASDFESALEFVNEYAPEHMELLVKDPFALLSKIRNAGEVLLGPHTPISFGNYCLGVNAILPTGGFAKSHSCTSVASFLKKISLAYCTAEGYERLAHTTGILAEHEGFPSHARSVRNRFEE